MDQFFRWGFCRVLFITLLSVLVPIATAPEAAAELRIEITKGVDNAVRVAVVPFEWRGKRKPPIGVMLVLLVIFMVAAPLMTQGINIVCLKPLPGPLSACIV